jgi:hypothetical protein
MIDFFRNERFFRTNKEGPRMTRNAIRLAWLLLGLAILSAVATLPALAQVSQSAAAADSSNVQEPQPPARAAAPNALNILPVAATQHGVPWRDPNTSGPTGFSAPAGAHLSYFGGPIITNVQVVQVLYGSGSYDPHVAGTSSPTMGQFFGDFTGSGSGLITLLAQYNTNVSGGTNQFFGNGTFGGLFQISPSGANNGSVITDAQIQSELLAQISAGNLPAPIIDFSGNPRTLYMVYFPPGKTITSPPPGPQTCTPDTNGSVLCAYHGTTSNSNLFAGKHVLYGVMPDMQSGSGCAVCGTSTTFGNYTTVSSHELVETMTDADVGIAPNNHSSPLAWYDTTDNGEIGDLCAIQQTAYTANGTTYTIQLEFSNSANNCVAPPPTPPPTSSSSPFLYNTPRDQQLACYGISVAPNFPSNCNDITNADDKQMCFGMSQNSQDPCMSIQDTNLKLACYGMSKAPQFPTNCRSITDPEMQAYCYGVSSAQTTVPNCNNVVDSNLRAQCLGIALHNASSCSSITNTNDRLFCQGIASRSQTPCRSIQ